MEERIKGEQTWAAQVDLPCKHLEILTKKISAGVSLDGSVRLLSLYLPPFHEKFWVGAMYLTLKAWALPFPLLS